MKKTSSFIMIILLALTFACCQQDAPGGEIQVSDEVNIDGVVQIKLVNEHNGYATTITDETDIANIVAFVGGIVGKPMGSGKGYYEGTYSVVFNYENSSEFTLTYGDDNVFYMGKGEDGHPIRYRLSNITISNDVLPSLSLYDQSVMIWDAAKVISHPEAE